jgi:hypothetical protein
VSNSVEDKKNRESNSKQVCMKVKVKNMICCTCTRGRFDVYDVLDKGKISQIITNLQTRDTHILSFPHA